MSIAALSYATPAIALVPTFATSYVSAAIPRGAVGHDAGVDVSGGSFVRLTASGSISLGAYGVCSSHAVGPTGCAGAYSFSRLSPSANTGTLLAAFAAADGRLISNWAPVGDAAYIAVPSGAARLMLRINGATGREYGMFKVVADVVKTQSESGTALSTAPSGERRSISAVPTGVSMPASSLSASPMVASAAVSSNSSARVLSATRGGGSPTAGQIPTTTLGGRAKVQFVLQRFGFGDTPADVTAIYKSGVSNWITAQLSPSTVNDSQLNTYMEAVPTYTGNSTTDENNGQIIEERLLQRQVATNRQLLEKLTLHWLEHFAVSESKVNEPAAMLHYENTVRADALGNFAQLVSDVAKEPAMLYWLDNNFNDGSNVAQNPPNENFGRELMQLYLIGVNELNPDGSVVIGSNGQPVNTYTETDVKQVADALTGFQVSELNPEVGNPSTFETVSFNPQNAPPAGTTFTILGKVIPDENPMTECATPTSKCIVNDVVASIAANKTVAPFQVKEMLQRLVTENPSPGYISRISAVWTANESSPNQIEKVVAAIAADPEFYTSQQSMVKEPLEYMIDSIRQLNGATSNPITAMVPRPLSNYIYEESTMSQETWDPPSVFSFYIPGDKEGIMSNSELLDRWAVAANVSGSIRTSTPCTNCNLTLNLPSLATSTPSQNANYLLDALVGGGTPELHALVANYLTANPNNINGAVWMILTSPEYEVN